MKPVKERPILFSAPMVRAILEGRKTVTRRVTKVQPRSKADIGSYGLGQPFIRNPDVTRSNPECPYGRPGDRLWVRETWEDVHPAQVTDGRYSQAGRAGIPGPPSVTYQTIYRADGPYPKVFYTHQHPYRSLEPDSDHGFKGPADNGYTGWTPSTHMPRWASRILLEITDVHVERLQGISEEQAEAEGVGFLRAAPDFDETLTAKQLFEILWDHINGEGAWKANPWVWCVSFRRVEQ
ncbi:hypothetical protein [Pseudomonas typographi]|uniref:hypothetical protein n=1 Tax=Pseudomonas typographi TaxID=2715964 RepID=UPI0016889C70|nr:hypothetical protein [Pseudomonas typographi]MBD1553854.1 hypothetical protein [Pseudomonas typographi]